MDVFKKFQSALSLEVIDFIDSFAFQSKNLMNRTTELDGSVQSKEHLINETREKIQPHVDSAEKHLKTAQELKQVKPDHTEKATHKEV